ncbi:methyl-accepting chemotaxis protein [Natrinema marinum]|uniref:methyl-accepting chemotaxis protein n=1 Tax=Natrinema marinum TaxID=2961598 RepID=UPI0020C8B9BD|nr:methyl-accepting chemotaxis protein [Natrinema marinum]
MGNPVTALSTRIRRSYALKLVLALLVVVAAVAAIGALIYVQTGTSLADDTESSMVQSTLLQSESVSEWVAHHRGQTRLLASSDAVRSGDTDRIRSTFRAEHERMHDDVAAIHYVDASSGEILASTSEEAEDASVSDAPWTNADLSGDQPVLSEPYDAQSVDVPVAGVVTEAAGDDDRLVVVLLDLPAFANSLETPADAHGSFTHVVDSKGTVVLSHHNEQIGGPNMQSDGQSNSMAVKKGLNDEVGYVEMDMESGHHTGTMSMGYARIEGTDWVLMTHIPAAEAFALQEEITQSVIALVLVSLFGLGLIGVVVGRSTSNSLGTLADKATELENGNLETELESDRHDEIGQLYAAFANMRDSLRESLQESENARERAERKGQEMAELAGHLETKATEFRDVMEQAADGDLTRRMDTDSHNEAMSEIATEYNEMMAEIEATTDDLKRFADEVTGHGQQVTASAAEVQQASSEVSNAVQRISDSTERQHETFRSVSEGMEEISASTEEITSLSNEVTTLAERTAEAGQEGTTAAKAAIDAMEEIDTDAEDAVAEIEHLQQQVTRVEEITEFIQKVAEQTNMLAMNANIEASRTGTGNEGFSAVASEVKELAAETKSSADEIDQLVADIKTQTDTTATEVRTTRQGIAETAQTVEAAVDALDEIAGYAKQTYDGTKEISVASQQQATATEEIVSMVDEAESLSQQVAEEASNAAAAAEEQTSALAEVTESASHLAERANNLQRRLNEFDTGGSQTAATPQTGD